MKNKLLCFLDGNELCIVKPGFVNLQESNAIFLILDDWDIKCIKKMEKEIND